MKRAFCTAALVGALVLAALPSTAVAARRPDTGPPLSVTTGQVEQNLLCTEGDAGKATVLLLPGTTLNTEENFGWNYAQAFQIDNRPFCTLDLPDRAMADIQVAAEYVVHAIRLLEGRSDRRISIVGYSQGGMISRWALKYWPDTRGMVDDLIGLAPSNHGTDIAAPACSPDCAPAIWQQRSDSAFIRALNAGPETWPGISYTVAYTLTDGIIVPAERSRLTTGQGEISNILLSDACPGHTTNHLSIGTYDPVAYALVADALNHGGPASMDRFDRAACTAVFHPGVNQGFAALHFSRVTSAVAATLLLTPHVPAEPETAPYAR